MQRPAAPLRNPAGGVPRRGPDHAAAGRASCAARGAVLSVLLFDPCISQRFKVLCFVG